MNNKILSLLLQSQGEFVSGQQIADQLQVSRVSISKHIRSLRDNGIEIEAVPNKGYRLAASLDLLDGPTIENGLHPFYHVEVVSSVASTNDELKKKADHLSEGTVLIADHQSAGRGRNGRSFYSPEHSGIYLSIFLRPAFSLDTALKLTAAASLAVVDSLEKNYDIHPTIKWVNDVLIEHKKVTGILCEAGFEMNSSRMDYMIVGIGINVHSYTMPPELQSIAGCVEDFSTHTCKRNQIIQDLLNSFYTYYSTMEDNTFLPSYKSHSCLIGKEVTVMEGKSAYQAIVVDIDDQARLIVKKGQKILPLSSGEIHIRNY